MSSDSHAVLGRYDPDRPQGDSELVTVQLLNFPLQLFAQSREHHDELLREFALIALDPQPPDSHRAVPGRLLELIEVLGRQYGGASDRMDSAREAAVERGELAMDLSYHVPRSIGAAMTHLNELMEAADEFCRSEQLLTLAATPLERAFRVWFIEEFVRQAAGAPPRPWDGPATQTTG
ncbi:MAG TPA: hypothetical protein VFT62_01965 [Mycobacteriales bacterium]|nr:hypothetical protein [Mycobacteriales bacterium]